MNLGLYGGTYSNCSRGKGEKISNVKHIFVRWHSSKKRRNDTEKVKKQALEAIGDLASIAAHHPLADTKKGNYVLGEGCKRTRTSHTEELQASSIIGRYNRCRMMSYPTVVCKTPTTTGIHKSSNTKKKLPLKKKQRKKHKNRQPRLIFTQLIRATYPFSFCNISKSKFVHKSFN